MHGGLFALSLVLVAFAPRDAAAQTMTISNPDSLPRVDGQGQPVTKRPITLHPEGVSRQDCLDDQHIHIPMALTGYAAQASLEAWASLAGVDCTSPTSRLGPQSVCWRVGSVPLAPTVQVDVPLRRLLEEVPGALAPADGDARCAAVDGTKLAVHFLYFAPGQLATPSAAASVVVDVDTAPPTPPAELRAVPGDGHVMVDWAPPPGISVLAGVNVYCAPNTAGSPGTAACESSPLALASAAERDATLRCASAIGAGAVVVERTGDSEPFTAGASYAFAATASDSFGNVSPLSALACAVAPQASSGDRDDGSGCAVSSTTPRGAGVGVGGALLAIAAAWLARRRRAHFTS